MSRVQDSAFPGSRNLNIRETTVEAWFTSGYLKYVRDAMLKGVSLEECNGCAAVESLGYTSFRQHTNRDLGLEDDRDPRGILRELGFDSLAAPVSLEAQVMNTCNLRCLMCHDSQSSGVLAENTKLGLSEARQADYVWSPTALHNLLRYCVSMPVGSHLVLRGGEPFVSSHVFTLVHALVESGVSSNIDLTMVTNGTRFSTRWESLLCRFGKVRIMLSIDGLGKLNSYIRFPSIWETIEKNLSAFNTRYDLTIATTVQNLNILRLHELVMWANQNHFKLGLSILRYPHYLQFSNLPKELLKKCHQSLNSVANATTQFDQALEGQLNDLLQCLDLFFETSRGKKDDKLWREFCSVMAIRDHHRGTSVLDVLPELDGYIEG